MHRKHAPKFSGNAHPRIVTGVGVVERKTPMANLGVKQQDAFVWDAFR